MRHKDERAPRLEAAEQASTLASKGIVEMPAHVAKPCVGLVAIGRNEGERLGRCLRSVIGRVPHAVYVDSGSIDGSVEMARSMGVDVIELDATTPFTAARARNRGFERLMEIDPTIDFVQFVDGDCEVVAGWLERAQYELEKQSDLAVVCGRRQELHPEKSVYNLLCDMEWDTPVGEAEACGGDAMIRAEAFRQVRGYIADIIAGEEPELCVRLRRAGWRVFRADAKMTLHDAAIERFSQWWRRTVRVGHAYAEGVARHGRSAERHKVPALRSMLLWGAVVPVAALGPVLSTGGSSLLILLTYPAQWWRVYHRTTSRNCGRREGAIYAFFTVLAKFPQLVGAATYLWARVRSRKSILIEYKAPRTDKRR